MAVWQHIQILVIGAILAPGKRTVTSALRIMGLSQEKHFQNYHRILNCAVWSSREVSRILLTLCKNARQHSGNAIPMRCVMHSSAFTLDKVQLRRNSS